MTSRPQPEAYCQADPVFYDTATRYSADDSSLFDHTRRPAPTGWRRTERGIWVVHTPEGHRMPAQGWKIHVSGLPENARDVIDRCWDHCVAHGLPFKFLRSGDVVTTHSLKYAPRSASGKIVTVYPADEEELHRTAEALADVLRGVPGPYILTDLRWGDGPVYVRYGGFLERYCAGPDGSPVTAVERPDGTLVPDDRRPVFTVPDWVDLPACLEPHLAARRAAGAGDDFPYRVESALHFSNGGGVYAARHTDGRAAVLKEARPYAGFDGRGRDAVTRLERERDALRALAGVPGVPELYGHHQVWEHHFLAVERMPGDTLQTWVARHYPLTRADPAEADLHRYARRAGELADRVAALIGRVHDRGLVFGDLHPANVLVDDEDRVSLVDFELAGPEAEAERLGLGNPGFSGSGTTGFDIDRHALAALRVWLLFPLTALAELDPGRTASYADLAERRFGLPPQTLAQARRLLAPAPERLAGIPEPLRRAPAVALDDPAPDWTAVRKSLAAAILLTATPERDDRLFPGDVRQFHTGAFGVAHGAAGVLWALHTTGAGRYPEHEEWLAAAVRDDRALPPGFFDGAHGIAYVLDRFDRREEALRLVEGADAALDAVTDTGLYRGLAGIGLNLLDLATRTGAESLRLRALDLAGRLGEAVERGHAPGIPAGPGRGSRAGLMHGWSGVALYFLRLHRATGDPGHLDLAFRALHHDLDLCVPAQDGSLQVDGGFRTLPYLAVGSAGIAVVAAEALEHREDGRLATALPSLLRAVRPEFTVEPHLFAGRAGLLAAAGAVAGRYPDAGRYVDLHLARLHWHALSYEGQLAFPGEQLRRLSMDLATGNAGMLLALRAALEGRRDYLPFLAP